MTLWSAYHSKAIGMRIGLVYDLFEEYPWRGGEPADADAEYEPEETVEALEEAIRLLGHEPVRIGTARDLLQRLPEMRVDVGLSIAEGAHSRNREAYAPLLFEMAGIPHLGSDALTLSLSLDKAWTKDLAAATGVPTPAYRVFRDARQVDEKALEGIGDEPGRAALSFPLFVKPRYEGSAKGITATSRVDSLQALRREVARTVVDYRQDALVETFVEGGGEFTVAVAGNHPPDPLPVLQRAVEQESRIGLHALEHRGLPEGDWDYVIEGTLTPDLEYQLQDLAVRVYEKLECLDFARLDFRVDTDGKPWFLEINTLPTFAPDGTFAVIAELMGRSYAAFLAEVLGRGLGRLFHFGF